jgi:hypothetical protein
MVSVLAIGSEVCGSNPAEEMGFKGDTNPQEVYLRRGSKAVGPHVVIFHGMLMKLLCS